MQNWTLDLVPPVGEKVLVAKADWENLQRVAKSGKYNRNQIMDTLEYELEYDDRNHDC